MGKLTCYLFFVLVLFVNIACTSNHVDLSLTKKIESKVVKLKPSDLGKDCQFLFAKNKKMVTQTMLWACLTESPHEFYPQLIDRFLSYKPVFSTNLLATILEFSTNHIKIVENRTIIKKLIDAGAPTDGITLNNILILNADVCDSVDLLVKNNLKKFQFAHTSINNPRYGHLLLLTRINRGYTSCPNSIRLIANYNSKLLETKGYNDMTPLNNYLVGVDHPEWDINIAKFLMTKKNIKFKDKNGYTPLHYIQLYMSDNKPVYRQLIKEIDKLSNSNTNYVELQNTVENLIIKKRPKCKDLLNKDVKNQKQFIACFTNGDSIETPYLVDKMIRYKPSASKSTLSRVIENLANDMSNSIHTKSLKRLINAGASTREVDVPLVIYGGDFACDALMLILKNNSAYYDDPLFLKSAPKGVSNRYGQHDEDLHALSAVGLERGICPNAIEFLAKKHPHLRNVQERHSKSIPLHIYLGDTHWPEWRLKTAEALMSKRNINMQDTMGNTPLHKLNSGSGSNYIAEHEIRIIKSMLEHGADIDIKNRAGKSVRDMFESKNPKLKAIFATVVHHI